MSWATNNPVPPMPRWCGVAAYADSPGWGHESARAVSRTTRAGSPIARKAPCPPQRPKEVIDMVTQFVPAPIAWDVEFTVSGEKFTYPVVGWVYDGQMAYAYVVDDNGAITSQAALFERLGATTCSLVRV